MSAIDKAKDQAAERAARESAGKPQSPVADDVQARTLAEANRSNEEDLTATRAAGNSVGGSAASPRNMAP